MSPSRDESGPPRLGPLDPYCYLLLIPLIIVGLVLLLMSPSWGMGMFFGGAVAVLIVALVLIDRWANRPQQHDEPGFPTGRRPGVQHQQRSPYSREGNLTRSPPPRAPQQRPKPPRPPQSWPPEQDPGPWPR